jgi:hypothetical protein
VFKPGVYSQAPLAATAEYANRFLGGAAGRPLELVECADSAEVCAEQFANDPAVIGVLEPEGDSLVGQLAGRKPAYSLVPGAATYYSTGFEDLQAMLLRSSDLLAGVTDPNVVFVEAFGGSQFGGIDALSKIIQTRYANSTVVEYSSVPAELSTRLQGVISAETDLLIMNVWFPQCAEIKQVIDQIGVEPMVFANVCNPIDGWYQPSLGFNHSDPDLESGAQPIIALLGDGGYDATAGVDPEFVQDATVFSTRASATLLTLVKLINEIGGGVTSTSFADQLTVFAGPPPLSGGTSDCAGSTILNERRLPGSCVRYVDLYRAENGKWVTQKPVDLSTSG